ncbi:hypothetical protein [Paracidovorax anthurii]|uniref:Uncharacterized protein n=1 Tax=Paracidovorax anthurii TaxID=78229 RepID=A0A328YXX3_9BURK|nr:hypothetical protein [Paracidovorax anthurii]RAR78003.1 hypothetical protein AX018_103341 [Paracidovorax anthurii]
MARFYIALHATVPAALLAAMLLHLWPPSGLEPLALRPAWAVWTLIAGWLLMSALLAALAQRATTLWRVALAAAGALLALAGGAGWALGAPQAPAMLASMAVLGLACAGTAAFIGPDRVQAARPARAPGPAHKAGLARARPWRHRLQTMAAHLPFWLAGCLALESFRIAHLAAAGAARPAGMLGLLLACLVALPAATLRLWLPRTSAVLWALAALAYAGLAARAGLAHWALAAGLCAVAAAQAIRAPVHGMAATPSRSAG